MAFPMPVPSGDSWHLYAPDAANDGSCTWCGGTESQHFVP